jgi:hypothetical protein
VVKRKYLIVISLAIAVTLIGSVLYSLYLKPQEKNGEGIAKIISVAHEPENPLLGEKITVTAFVENASECNIQYRSYFAEGRGGGWSMGKVSEGKYRYETYGGFENGTEVSYRVCAVGYDGIIAVSDEYIIQVGKVERSRITTLTISNVHHSPQNPTRNDRLVTVWADAASNVTVSKIEFIGMWFYSTSGGTYGDKMMEKSENTYEYLLLINPPYGDGIPKGAKIFYKVIAQDESGNTVVSPVYSFEVS